MLNFNNLKSYTAKPNGECEFETIGQAGVVRRHIPALLSFNGKMGKKYKSFYPKCTLYTPED